MLGLGLGINRGFVGGGGAAAGFLLDDYTGAAAAYSVRHLNSSYTGSALRVREDSGDTELDIGFDSNGDLDTAAIAGHCGVNNGYVTTWYDQSGNSNDAGQATAGSQPQIYNGTAVITENGKPLFTRANYMQTSLLGNSTAYIFAVVKTIGGEILLGDVNGNGDYLLLPQPGNTGSATSGFSVNSYYFNGTLTSISTRDDAYQALDLGNQQLLSFDLDSSNVGVGYLIGYAGAAYGSYNMQELIIYHSDQSSNRTGIETNIDDYYQIPGM